MIIDQLNKEISAIINALPENGLGGVFFNEEFFDGAAEPDMFQEPPPDVLIDFPEDADEDWWVVWRKRYPYLLGMYIPMNSPGQIILFGNNLTQFYKSLIRVIYPNIPYLTKLDLSSAWTLVRMKTHFHEMFHYYCDVLHGLLGGSYTYMIEEALAVAWARHSIQGQRAIYNSQIGRMNGLLYSQLMERAFIYRSPGYDNWVHHSDDIRLKSALVEYMMPGDFRRLQGNGVDVENLIFGMLGQCRGGFIERVW